MKILKTIAEVQCFSDEVRGRNERLGFVPTMGALHRGHAALIDASVAANEHTVVSIYVNSTQFDVGEDLAKYPRTFTDDCELVKAHGGTAVFFPNTAEIYPPGFSTSIKISGVSERLCGAYRPSHFEGVATVVARLFQIIRPHSAYFGIKDIQQCMVIRQLVSDLLLNVELEFCPTVREPDGLALSSRNQKLDEAAREKAPVLYSALQRVLDSFKNGERSTEKLAEIGSRILNEEPALSLQYFEVLQYPDLLPVSQLDSDGVVAVAAFFGSTRLIDNTLLK